MRHLASTTITGLLLLTTAACSQSSQGTSDGPDGRGAGGTPSSEPQARQPITAEAYDPSLFGDDAAHVDNHWYPLRPGSRMVYRGSSLEDGERLPHTVDAVVTDLVKVVDGVPNVVVWERDFSDGELVEAELAMFAQDKDGNVWHMGEYPEEYEQGKIDKAPAWIHGERGATAGITIMGEPRLGTPDYAQGYAPPPISWADRGKVYKTGERKCVPAGCFHDIVVIEEFENSVPNAFQDKYYAPGVGVVRVSWRGSQDDSKEVLNLVRATRLTPAQLAHARDEALRLERRAYRIAKDVYADTPPAQVPAQQG